MRNLGAELRMMFLPADLCVQTFRHGGHVVKHGLDWISKTWTGLVKHGLVKHGLLVKHGFVKHGFVKHGLTWCFFLR